MMVPNITTSPRMERVLNRAAEIGKLHTGEPFVGTENVLRALVEDQDGIAAQVLRELGVTERIAERLDEIMSSASYRTPSRDVYRTPPNK
jgi:ATP-dependent Clp protease ATP-binding subunit ClpA